MQKFINKTTSILFILIVLLLSFIQVKAAYLEPIEYNGEDCFDVYEVVKIKNGIVEDKNNSILGKGKSFYINNNFLSIYEKSIVYKNNNIYKPIKSTTYTSNSFQINLPQNTYVNIKKEPFYLTKKQLKNYFLLDIESQGILYDKKIKVEAKPDGVSKEFLKENITSLDFILIDDNIYRYDENGVPNTTIYFENDKIRILWNKTTSQDKVNLLIKALYPNSYELITTNMLYAEGFFDNRNYNCNVLDNELEIIIKD